ncbi:hypothetical protein TRVL_05685 [Trypanosoma vivax]|nr:hypothetical protein TRVL_05685 [Trypanosoma vivax]
MGKTASISSLRLKLWGKQQAKVRSDPFRKQGNTIFAKSSQHVKTQASDLGRRECWRHRADVARQDPSRRRACRNVLSPGVRMNVFFRLSRREGRFRLINGGKTKRPCLAPLQIIAGQRSSHKCGKIVQRVRGRQLFHGEMCFRSGLGGKQRATREQMVGHGDGDNDGEKPPDRRLCVETLSFSRVSTEGDQ